jgi:hypothetical protein
VNLFLISNDLNNIQELSDLSRFFVVSGLFCEMFEGVKGVIRSRRSKTDRQCNGQKKKIPIMICKTRHRKPKIEQHEPHTYIKK